jgi:hypothetical protein
VDSHNDQQSLIYATAAFTKIAVVWYVAPYNLVDCYRPEPATSISERTLKTEMGVQ